MGESNRVWSVNLFVLNKMHLCDKEESLVIYFGAFFFGVYLQS